MTAIARMRNRQTRQVVVPVVLVAVGLFARLAGYPDGIASVAPLIGAWVMAEQAAREHGRARAMFGLACVAFLVATAAIPLVS